MPFHKTSVQGIVANEPSYTGAGKHDFKVRHVFMGGPFPQLFEKCNAILRTPLGAAKNPEGAEKEFARGQGLGKIPVVADRPVVDALDADAVQTVHIGAEMDRIGRLLGSPSCYNVKVPRSRYIPSLRAMAKQVSA
jgi:hypothetical protein